MPKQKAGGAFGGGNAAGTRRELAGQVQRIDAERGSGAPGKEFGGEPGGERGGHGAVGGGLAGCRDRENELGVAPIEPSATAEGGAVDEERETGARDK